MPPILENVALNILSNQCNKKELPILSNATHKSENYFPRTFYFNLRNKLKL